MFLKFKKQVYLKNLNAKTLNKSFRKINLRDTLFENAKFIMWIRSAAARVKGKKNENKYRLIRH